MASIVSLVSKHYLVVGDTGMAVKAAQLALGQAGYNVPITGIYSTEMEAQVKRFQTSHGLRADGEIGPKTGAFLDLPHETVVATAQPVMHASDFPHDDTASMVAFYGDPRTGNAAWQSKNLIQVVAPWQMFYDGKPIKGIQFHKKAAPALKATLQDIWDHYRDIDAIHAVGMHNFSGSYNYRPIRGSSRLSTHAFGAGIDFDAARNPMTTNKAMKYPIEPVVQFFKAHGAWWGGDFNSRRDGMHFQWAHE